MEDVSHLIIKALEAPETLDAEDFALLRRACHDYPACTLPAALLLKYDDARLSDRQREEFRARVALFSGDRDAVMTMLDTSGRDFAHFYPPMPEHIAPATDSAIDTFLETYGHQSPEEDALLERMIFNPVPDYAETLARQESSEPTPPTRSTDSRDALIDAFLDKNPVPTQDKTPSDPVLPADTPAHHEPEETQHRQTPPPHRDEPTDPGKSSLLSESLAKIFIKQGRYERAYEIISNLNLNYPEKSVYFAVQLRFLQKLIINQRAASRPENPSQEK